MTVIGDLVNNALTKASEEMARGTLDLRSIIYQAVQAGMADAYQRGMDVNKPKPEIPAENYERAKEVYDRASGHESRSGLFMLTDIEKLLAAVEPSR